MTYLSITALITLISAIYSCQNQRISATENGSKQAATSVVSNKLDSNAKVIFHDSKNNYWLSSTDLGVYRYDGKKLKLFDADDGLANYRVMDVQEDDLGNIYFDTPNDVYKFDGDRFRALPIKDSNDTNNTWKANPGDLWFRMGWDKRGPYRYNGEYLQHVAFPTNEKEAEFYRENPNASFNPYSIYSMYKDSQGNIWFGTSNMGVYMFDGESISWMYEKHHLETPDGGNFGVRSIGEDSDGNYWICNPNYKYTLLPSQSNDNGLNRINYKRQIGIKNPAEENLYFYSMHADRNGNMLMYAQEDGLWLNDGKTLTPFYIQDGEKEILATSVYKDRNGVFWFSTVEDGIYSYDGEVFERFGVE